MSFGDVIGLMVAVGGFVGMLGVIGEMYRRRLEHKERIAELRVAGSSVAPASEAGSSEVARLEHRIRVLERIATDRQQGLIDQIEALRDERTPA